MIEKNGEINQQPNEREPEALRRKDGRNRRGSGEQWGAGGKCQTDARREVSSEGKIGKIPYQLGYEARYGSIFRDST